MYGVGEEEACEMTDPFDFDPFEQAGAIVTPADPALAAEVAVIRAQQEVFHQAVDAMIELYRGFDKTRRQDLKVKLKKIYEILKELGTMVGVSRVSTDNLWKG